MFRALRHRNFRLYVVGMAISLSGTWMQQLAQSWLVYRLTKSEFLLGLVWFCANIPLLILSPLAGVAADRYSRRKIVMLAQAAAMAQAVVLAALTLTGVVQVWHIMGLALILGVAGAFDTPARQSMFVHLVGKKDLLNAISLNSATFNAARVVGPPLGGLIVAQLGEGVCFALNAVSFIAVLGSLWAMDFVEPPPAARIETALERLRQGFRYAWSRLAVRNILVAAGLVSFAASAVSSLAPVFADAVFHRGAPGLGLLTGAQGTGAILGVLSLARRGGTRGLPDVILKSNLALGVTLCVYAWNPSYWAALGLMVITGMSIMRQNAAANTTIQVRIDDEYRGRIMGFYSMMVLGMFPVGSLMAGSIAQAAGVRWATFLAGLMGLGTAALIASRRRLLRDWLAGGER